MTDDGAFGRALGFEAETFCSLLRKAGGEIKTLTDMDKVPSTRLSE